MKIRKHPARMTEIEWRISVSERITRLEVLVTLLAATVWGATALMLLTGRG